MEKTTPSDCYCHLWQTNPGILRKEGIPKGFCGICQVCGQPGHTRHYPGPKPYTGSWCSACYQALSKSRWPTSPDSWLLIGIIVLLVVQLLPLIREILL